MPKRIFAQVTQVIGNLLAGSLNASTREVTQARTAAEHQFREHGLRLTDGTPLKLAEAAKVLDKTETFNSLDGRVNNFVLTVMFVTKGDQYFLFKSNPAGRPFLKQLPESRARLVLKDRFQSYEE